MKTEEVLFIMQNREITLNNARIAAVNSGDIETVMQIDGDLLSTQVVVHQIKASIEAMNTIMNS
jgi:hypothetical protein